MQNTGRLLEFIRAQTNADNIALLEFRQLTGGAIQENHGLSVHMEGGAMPGDHHFVIRSDAAASVSASLSKPQEFEVLQVAHQAGVRVPRPFWLCMDTCVLGSEFYVMQWAPGVASPRALVKDDSMSPAQRKALLFQLGHDLARLHQVKSSTQLASLPPRPDTGAAQYRIQECKEAMDRLQEFHPALELGLSYLQKFACDSNEWALCHGDFRTGNYLVDEGELSAVLDWEFASWSDPYEDLGWLCARSWRFNRPEREAGGVGDKADFFAGYESVTGKPVDVERVAYWEVMGSVRWAVVALEQAHRHLSGQQKSLELALTGRMLPEIQQDLMDHLRFFLTTAQGTHPMPHRVTDVAPVLAGPDQGEQGVSQPDGAALLHEARSVVLGDVLAALPPEQHYNARMIANAMAIAIRELEQGKQIRIAQQHAIMRFYSDSKQQAAGIGIPCLARDIRRGRFADTDHPQLFCLIDVLLHYELLLSNPKRA